MTDPTPYTDANGNQLSHEELKKLLRENVSPQYGWYKGGAQRRIGTGRPPPGVREGKNIRYL